MNQPRVIALGFFDGVHLGHGALLKACRKTADCLGVSAACVTFDRHPDTLVFGQKVNLLTSLSDREQIMKEQYRMDDVLTLHFDREMMDMPWLDFIHEILRKQFGGVAFVCGHDFRFGRKGEGNALRLQEESARLGLSCQVIPPVELDGIIVSSTYIRSLVERGDMEQAQKFLGHPYTLSGRVVGGKHIGRTMGTPTANLQIPEVLLPPRGVYACKAHTEEGTYLAVTNIGTRPTVEGEGLTVEPWLLDFAGDLYGSEMTLELHKFLRPEQRFPTLEALRDEIRRNADQTRAYFSEK